MSERHLHLIESLFEAAGLRDVPVWVKDFSHAPGVRVHFGPGISSKVGELALGEGMTRVLVVTDRGLVAAGHVAPVLEHLIQAGIAVAVFDQVVENPTTDTVKAVVAAAREHGADGLIGLGGGSSMDAARGANFILTNGGEMKDYRGKSGRATQPMLPLIVIPTTAGTGSETQSFCLISDAETHVKMACGDKKAAARHALLDPALTLSLPRSVTALTGIDAIAHAIESAVCLDRNPISSEYSRVALTLLSRAFPQVLQEPQNLTARGMMLLGAALAGVAIENSMLGAAHASANPLTAHFDVPHGAAVALMLPHVMAFNRQETEIDAIYRSLSPEEPLELRFIAWRDLAGLPASLASVGVNEGVLSTLAQEATQQMTGKHNPVPMSEEAFLALYRGAIG